jgi:hypothetical protein
MFYHPSALTALAPTGDPTPEALFREEFLKLKAATTTETVVDHRAPARARTIRAQVAARVGSFFSIS